MRQGDVMIQPRLPLTLADKLDAFLAAARLHGLRVKALRLSPDEFRELHRDPEAKAYGDGRYAGVRLRVAHRRGPSPWADTWRHMPRSPQHPPVKHLL